MHGNSCDDNPGETSAPARRTASLAAGTGHTTPPRTWLMLGGKAGDNTQITALAEALGWPFEIKRLAYKKTELFTNLFAGPTTAGLVQATSDRLEPPWPELVISAGRRNEPLVRWIQAAAAKDPSLPRVRLVHVGRPWALHECFDLIVTTPQYRLPKKPHILHNELPLQRVNTGRLEAEARHWQPRLAHLPKPHITVLLGGHAGPYNFDRENGALLGYHANAMALAKGGSLLVTTSARTPEAAIQAFEAQLRAPHTLHRFTRFEPEAQNPFFAFLGMADEVIVTSDSMSMLAEAIASGKPTHIFDLSRGKTSNRPPNPADGSITERSLTERLADFRTQAIMYTIGMHALPSRLTRDVRIIHTRQVEAGRATWLGQTQPKHHQSPLTDLPKRRQSHPSPLQRQPTPTPQAARQQMARDHPARVSGVGRGRAGKLVSPRPIGIWLGNAAREVGGLGGKDIGSREILALEEQRSVTLLGQSVGEAIAEVQRAEPDIGLARHLRLRLRQRHDLDPGQRKKARRNGQRIRTTTTEHHRVQLDQRPGRHQRRLISRNRFRKSRSVVLLQQDRDHSRRIDDDQTASRVFGKPSSS